MGKVIERLRNRMRLDQQVGAVFGFVGVAVFLLRIVRNILNDTFSTLLFLDPVYLGFGSVFLFLAFWKRETLTIPLKHTVMKIQMSRSYSLLQFVLMTFLVVVAILNDNRGDYNIPMMGVAVLMGMKYGILGRRGTYGLILTFAVLTEISAYRETGEFMRSAFVLLFMFFTFGIGFLLYSDELDKQFELLKKYRVRLIELQSRVEKMQAETISLDKVKLTPREVEVLKILCLERLTNREISMKLGVKEQTVKTHLRRIFDKTGFDDRHDLIEMFRGNWLT